MSERVRIGVIGCGYWGQNLIRNLVESDDFYVASIADQDQDLRVKTADRYCIEYTHATGADLIDDAAFELLEAVAITTPVETHYDLGVAALMEGLHVLMAKPLADTYDRAESLAAEAIERKLALVTDHTFVFGAPVRELQALTRGVVLGEIQHVSSVRTNLGLVRPDCDVVWDLAVHDLSILEALIRDQHVTHVSCVGADPLKIGRCAVAHLVLWYSKGLLATVEVSWLSPVKVRRMVVTGSDATVIWDDTNPSEPVRVYDVGVDLDPETARVSYRSGDVMAPRVAKTEALANVAAAFAAEVRSDKPRGNVGEALEVVKLLEAASESLADGGVKVPL